LPLLNDYFSSVTKLPGDEPTAAIETCDLENSFEFRPFMQHEVLQTLKSINGKTAAGHDGLRGGLLKSLAPALVNNMAKIFNKSLEQNTFPDSWKKAHISAIFKGKGSKKDPAGYRPISVLPVLGRCFEKMAAAQLYEYCERREIIPPQQFGFRRGSSCEMALLTAMDKWVGAIDEGAMVGALLVDLSKAFDTVPHQLLLKELVSIGCSSKTTEWFKSYLSNRLQRVTRFSETTPWVSVTRGVPQGSCLSPLLFNIFVRDLPCDNTSPTSTQQETSDTFQWADDVTHSHVDPSIEVIGEKLVASIDRTKRFCDEHHLVINATKTRMIVFKSARKKLPEDYSLEVGGVRIKPAKSVQLLGFHLDCHLT
jgi:hypothetical protein